LSKGDLKAGAKEFVKDFHDMRRQQVQIRGVVGPDLDEDRNTVIQEMEQRADDRDDLAEAHALIDDIIKQQLEIGEEARANFEENQQLLVQMILQEISNPEVAEGEIKESTELLPELATVTDQQIAAEAHHFAGIAGAYRDSAFEIRDDIHEGEKGDGEWFHEMIEGREDAKSVVEQKKEKLKRDLELGLAKGDLKASTKAFVKDFHDMRREQHDIRGVVGPYLDEDRNAATEELEQRAEDRDDLAEAHALIDEIMKEQMQMEMDAAETNEFEESQQMLVQMILQAISNGDDYSEEDTVQAEESGTNVSEEIKTVPEANTP